MESAGGAPSRLVESPVVWATTRGGETAIRSAAMAAANSFSGEVIIGPASRPGSSGRRQLAASEGVRCGTQYLGRRGHGRNRDGCRTLEHHGHHGQQKGER